MSSATAQPLPPSEEYLSEQHQRGNIWRLTAAQALAGANSVVTYATGAIIGNTLAPDPALATLPISVFVVGMALCILPFGVLAKRYGRRAAFLAGTSAGIITGLLSMLALITSSFWLFCVATLFGGAYAAVALSFRFAATDGVEPKRQARALSLVMGGGVLAGIIGPQLVTWTMYLWPLHIFSATFAVQAAVAALSAFLLWGVHQPKTTQALQGEQGQAEKNKPAGRPLKTIAFKPRFIVAVTCGAVSYMVMNFLMTAAPLAMHFCGHSQTSSNLGLQWHVIAMYAPSFFTGRLIERFGAIQISLLGLGLTALSSTVGLSGIEVPHFWWMLILLGLGWNFGFLGASALVLQCHRPEEKVQVQGLNDFIVFSVMAVGSFSSGGILALYGWDQVLWVSFVPVALALLLFALIKQRRQDADQARSSSV
ncbi:MFS transporter [Oceanospirillum beijerinckii]|uniref:MFS transporter n=1 Tax=Oceanospirillum beijerinckii TaxID=64976 RepID=UPI00040E2AB7|nr:MFS transporter [Oceanospirillum beijerinckii]MAC45837.1 MFS transporter [Oceanospirillum sp.]